ncbi:thioester reductase domain-containing protein [uncultured Vibrio sp.]|uniref:thioester reductase domain-containing protein n=1 Tax=uncultured Vibrio sp. TaxID=114054 RepID=UPI00262408F2|nr:thioester reductase domain-containing protein [uncultured Vibrio sp.]
MYESDLMSWLKKSFVRYECHTAFLWQSQAVTYGELHNHVRNLAQSLEETISDDEVLNYSVAISTNNLLDAVTAMLASLWRGIPFVFIDDRAPLERQQYILETACSLTLVKCNKFEHCSPTHKEDYTDTACVLFTSGTTGKPKGIRVPLQGLLNSLLALNETMKIDEHSTVLQVSSPTFDAFCWEVLGPLLCGSQIILNSRQEVLSPDILHDKIARYKPSHLLITPSLLEILSPAQCTSLTTITLCGEVATASLLDKWQLNGRVLLNGYGPAEMTLLVTIGEFNSSCVNQIGRPISHTDLLVLDSNGSPSSKGELFCAGMGMFNGYLGEQADRTTFVKGRAYYRTGDLVEYNALTKSYSYLGRVDDQYKVNGVRIEPKEIEASITSHPLVEKCVVLPVEHNNKTQAAVVIQPYYLSTEKRDSWKTIFENVDYAKSKFEGWMSEDTGEGIEQGQMESWLSETVERILDLKGKRILEVGCGQGSIAWAIAPHCERYLATDYASQAVARVQSCCHDLPQIESRVMDAADINTLEETFDIVILNSVIQYFDDEAFLEYVLDSAFDRLSDHGAIFLGDIRDRNRKGMLSAQLGDSRNINELFLSASWFYQYAKKKGLGVEVKYKLSDESGELFQYRFDVVLSKGTLDQESSIHWSKWQDLTGLSATPNYFGVVGIPDGRVVSIDGVFPSQLVNMIDSYELITLQSDPSESANLIAIYRHSSSSALPALYDVQLGAGYSLYENQVNQRLIAQHLRDCLPASHLPSHILFTSKLPLTVNGKVDKGILETDIANLLQRAPKEATCFGNDPIYDAWCYALGRDSLSVDDDFFATGGDSLSAVTLAADLSASLGYRISPQDIFDAPSISQFRERIGVDLDDNLQISGNWLREQVESFHCDYQPEYNYTTLQDARAILITGATGYLGGRLLEMLASQSCAAIYCVVRGEKEDNLLDKLIFTADTHGINLSPYKNRITAIAGDISNPNLGLEDSIYSELIKTVDLVYHTAAMVNFVASYHSLAPINVEGTANVINFCLAGQPKTLHHVSTLGVYGLKSRFTMQHKHLENEPLDSFADYLALDIAYLQTKWVAESMVQKAFNAGLTGTVLRPGFVLCDESSGLGHKGDFWHRFITACNDIGCYPNLERMSEYFTTTDWFVTAVKSISNDAKSAELGPFNIGPKPEEDIEVKRLFEIFNQYKGNFQCVEFDVWLRNINLLPNTHPFSVLRPLFNLKVEELKALPLAQYICGELRVVELYKNAPRMDISNTLSVFAESSTLSSCPTTESLRCYWDVISKEGKGL